MLPAARLEEAVRRGRVALAHPATRQLIRYAVAGLAVTQFAALIYSLFAMQGVSPFLANAFSTSVALVAGYAVHSRWSFRGGDKDSEGLQIGRFLSAALLAFTVNSFWIWLTVELLGLSPLAPVPLMMMVTPLMSFLLNRYWVFRAA